MTLLTHNISMSLVDFMDIMANVETVSQPAAQAFNMIMENYHVLDRPIASTDTSTLGRLHLLNIINKINQIDFKSKLFSLPRQFFEMDRHAGEIIMENKASTADNYVREFCLIHALGLIAQESSPLPYNWDDKLFIDFIDKINTKFEHNYLDSIDTQNDTISIPIFVLGKEKYKPEQTTNREQQ